MRSPKLFILIIFLISGILLLIDLPGAINTKNIPLIGSKLESVNFSKINLDLKFLKIQKDLNYRLGLDLQGGTRLTYKIDMSNISQNERQNAFESARNVIERRINFFGVSEPSIQSLKVGEDYRIIVELPGIENTQEALDLIGQTAQLTFWEEKMNNENKKEGSPSAIAKTDLSGKDLKSANVVFDPNTGKPQVQLNFSVEGTKKFADITKRNVGKPLAIVLDNQIIEAPDVREPILNGNAVITGNFTVKQAKNLSISLNAGALPAPLQVISQSTIGPALGIDMLKKSLIGGILGFLSIVLFMIALYKKEGILASVALIIYTIIVLFIFKIVPVTLTLAGIAGFILSIGMAVDANILIFERMKEEKRSGKSRDVAIEMGFKRAWTSIRDSNISSLITSFILYYFGTGIVRGFALTLAIGILVSMFSAITVTRNLLRVFDKN